MPSKNIGLTLFLTLAFALGWLALWIISIYLNGNNQLAVLFLPLGLRLALFILLPKRFWFTILFVEAVITVWLYHENLLPSLTIFLSCLLSLITAYFIQRVWMLYTLYWQRLLLLLASATLNSLLHIVLTPLLSVPSLTILLTSFTSGIILVPFIYLVHEYLKQQNLKAFLDKDSFDPSLQRSLFIWGSIFFAIGICIQLTLTPAMESLLLVFILLPNVIMAYQFGWQGGVLSAVIGSLLLTITRHATGAFAEVQELELFLSTQALLGIGLGIAVSRQQQLDQHIKRYQAQLESELDVRLRLAEQLVQTEEKIRKDIARELHDEIGQNITAIKIQAMIVAKTAAAEQTKQAAQSITQLSDRIHQTTQQLLRQLRPPAPSEMSLRRALSHLVQEFQFEQQGINCQFNFLLKQNTIKDETLRLTLYRLLQELLNNISKHAYAKHVIINLSNTETEVTLSVSDDGIGISEQHSSGFGLRGIGERVTALNGHWEIKPQSLNQPGTYIIVNLPTKLNKK